MQQASITPIHLQATRLVQHHGTGIEGEASNDDNYLQEDSRFSLLCSIAGNFVGGAVLLSAMYALPHLFGFILS